MTDFVLVPGAWHGGWWYDPVVEALSAEGHLGRAVTLAGLGETPEHRPVTLGTHIDQVAALVTEPVVLVGHSYGGMVVTAVADRLPHLVQALVMLDADVPGDGDSSWSLAPPSIRDPLIEGAGADGLTVEPLPFFDSRARSHPLATLIQRVRLTGAWRQVPEKVFVAAMDTPGGLQAPASMAKVRDDPAWRYEEWPVSHNVLRDGPDRVAGLLLSLSAAGV
ncbi:alpha/beta hydrolase family protein [Actinoplanes sp. NPDC023801]|uniref:alpha/beta hydrolase family protein n=1 Tax=Actinoplanes sp. NPDC023801 TaxID=3154595 RepID=UPI0033D1377C